MDHVRVRGLPLPHEGRLVEIVLIRGRILVDLLVGLFGQGQVEHHGDEGEGEEHDAELDLQRVLEDQVELPDDCEDEGVTDEVVGSG